MKTSYKITCGDRSTSDVVVRIRTAESRDEWIYCHSDILIQNSKYFADRLSDSWPTCQILDSRNCVEVHCEDLDLDYHVTVLRLFYFDITKLPQSEMWSGVKSALCILRVAVELGCPHIVTACVSYVESCPWEEAEEEEILKVIPSMGSETSSILARLQPVNQTEIMNVFRSTMRFATSSPPLIMDITKRSAQEQLEYMLTEDDDAPLLTVDNAIKSEVREQFTDLFARFNELIGVWCTSDLDESEIRLFEAYLQDLNWACQILSKLEMMKEIVKNWMLSSEKTIKVAENLSKLLETRLEVTEIAGKVLEAVGDGAVILPTVERAHAVKVWLPFVRRLKVLRDRKDNEGDDDVEVSAPTKTETEVWHTMESSFVSIILTLPSCEQAEILTAWLNLPDEEIRYPDLTEAFEVWCYRSKVAKKRVGFIERLGHANGMCFK